MEHVTDLVVQFDHWLEVAIAALTAALAAIKKVRRKVAAAFKAAKET